MFLLGRWIREADEEGRYGGLVQLLAGMWEMAVGNTFGATALSSFGGFWISFAIIFTPGGFEIMSTLEGEGADTFADSFGLYLMVSLFLLLIARCHGSGSARAVEPWLRAP